VSTYDQVELLLELHRLESAANGTYGSEDFLKVEEKLERALLKDYLKVRQRRGGGVALLQKRTCSGCRMVYPEAHPIVQYRELVHKCEYCGRLLVVPKTSVPEEPLEEDSIAETSLMDDHEDADADADDSGLLAEIGNTERIYQVDDDMLSHLMLQAEPNDTYFKDENVEEPDGEEETGVETESEYKDADREEPEIDDIEDEEPEWEESEKHLREEDPENARE